MKTMKTTLSIRYNYDPSCKRLVAVVNDKLYGGFSGVLAEQQFCKLLETGAVINIIDMSTKIKSDKVRRLRALWIKQGIDQYRESILSAYGVQSTADLSLDQLNELIMRFSPSSNLPISEQMRKLRGQVLVLLNKLGVYSTNNDWAQVNAYLMQPRIVGKPLYLLTEQELISLVKKLYSIEAKERKIIDKLNDQATKN